MEKPNIIVIDDGEPIRRSIALAHANDISHLHDGLVEAMGLDIADIAIPTTSTKYTFTKRPDYIEYKSGKESRRERRANERKQKRY